MSEPTWRQGTVTLYLGDCLEILPTLAAGSVDAVVTDPPYPDYHTDKWQTTPIDFLAGLDCRQFVFWSARAEFPLDYTARHVWNKNPSNRGAQYEFIFERNGGKHYKVFTFYMVNSTVAAQMTRDVYTGHPSQKPINLLRELIKGHTKAGATILDPFMGSGTTGVAAIQTGRNFIGIEIDPAYFEIAKRRIEEAQAQLALPGVPA